MSSVGLSIISIGFLFVAIAPTTDSQTQMIINGLIISAFGVFIFLKNKGRT